MTERQAEHVHNESCVRVTQSDIVQSSELASGGQHERGCVQISECEFIVTRKYTLQDMYNRIKEYELRSNLSQQEKQERKDFASILFVDKFIL